MQVERLSKEPADEELREELRSALKARRENEALRDHIEHLKNGEVDMGLEASKRMSELSSEYMQQVDKLTREKEAVQARAEAAEEEAKQLAAVMHAHGFATPLSAQGTKEIACNNILGDEAGAGEEGITPSTIANPAALLFASPIPCQTPVDYIATPVDATRGGGDEKTGADEGFAFGSRGSHTASTATLFNFNPPAGARRMMSSSQGSVDSLTGSMLAANAARVIQSMGAHEETTPTSGGDVGGKGDTSGAHALAAALTPSGAAAEGAAAVAMAAMDHPTLVAEAANLVAANVRLERERRALVERLERAEAASAHLTASVASPAEAVLGVATPGSAMPGVPAMILPAGTPGMLLTPSGNPAAVSTQSHRTNDDVDEDDEAPPQAPPSWDMCGTEFALSQMTEALDRVRVAASEAASLLEFDEESGCSPSGSTNASGGSDSDGMSRAMRRKQRKGVDPAVVERQRKARELTLEAAQAATLAGMQREHLEEVLEVERQQARVDATEVFTAMQHALERLGRTTQSATHAATPASEACVTDASITIGDAIVTPCNANTDAEAEAEAGDANTLRAEDVAAANCELALLRRQLAAAAAKAEEERTELQYRAAEHEKRAERLAAELEAASKLAEAAHGLAERRQRQAASLEAKHTRLSMELSAALQKLQETEREARAEERKLSLSFSLKHQNIGDGGSGGTISASPLIAGTPTAAAVVGIPPDLARIDTSTPSPSTFGVPEAESSDGMVNLGDVSEGSEHSDASPAFATLVRKVSATRSSLAAALAVAEQREADDVDTVDEATEMVRDLRVQLEAARLDASAAHARIAAAEEKAELAAAAAASAEAKAAAAEAKAAVAREAVAGSPSPSPIARDSPTSDDSAVLDELEEKALEEVKFESPEAQRHRLEEARGTAAAAEAALSWARRAEAAAHAEAETERKAAAAARAEASSAVASLESARSEAAFARSAAAVAADKLAGVTAEAERLRESLAAAKDSERELERLVETLTSELVKAEDTRNEAVTAAADNLAAVEHKLAAAMASAEGATQELAERQEEEGRLRMALEQKEEEVRALRKGLEAVQEEDSYRRSCQEEVMTQTEPESTLEEQEATAEEALRSLAIASDPASASESSALSEAEATVQRLTADLEATKAELAGARAEAAKAKQNMRNWKDEQTAAVAKWREDAEARTVAAEAKAEAATKAAIAAKEKVRAAEEDAAKARVDADTRATAMMATASAMDHSSVAALLAENRELIAEAEKRASEYEALEMTATELRARAETAEAAAADAPHLRAENYDLAVKHRSGLRRLHEEIAARRKLEERVEGYEHTTRRLEATVEALEGALKEAHEMCALARASFHAAAAEKAATEAATAALTPPRENGARSMNASSPTPAAAAAEAVRQTMAAALEAAEKAACAAREEAGKCRAAAAASEQEAAALRATAEQRRADLAVLRDECTTLRWKVLNLEEDARISPCPRHGGPPPRPLPSDSPFSSIKAFSRLAMEENFVAESAGRNDTDDADRSDGSITPTFVTPNASAPASPASRSWSPVAAPPPATATGGPSNVAAAAMEILALTPPASDNVKNPAENPKAGVGIAAVAAEAAAAAARAQADEDDQKDDEENSEDDDLLPRHSFRAVASVALIAASIRAKADILLTTSSAGSVTRRSSVADDSSVVSEGSPSVASHSLQAKEVDLASGPEPGISPRTPDTVNEESTAAEPHPLKRSVSDLKQTETWLDEAIAAAESIRRENEDLKRQLAEAAMQAADAAEAVAEAETERERAEAALSAMTEDLQAQIEAAAAAASAAEAGAAAAAVRGNKIEAEVSHLQAQLQSKSKQAETFSAAAAAATADAEVLRAAVKEKEAEAAAARCRIADLEEEAKRSAMILSERSAALSTSAAEVARLTELCQAERQAAAATVKEAREAAAKEVMEAMSHVRELRTEVRALETAAAESSAARAAAECAAAEAREDAAHARAQAKCETAAAAAAHDARRRAEAEIEATQRQEMEHVETEDADTNTTPRALPAPPTDWLPVVPSATGAMEPVAALRSGTKFATALRAHTERLRDDVARAEDEVTAHREHADRVQREIALLASDLPSARAQVLLQKQSCKGKEEKEAPRGAETPRLRSRLSVSIVETTTSTATTTAGPGTQNGGEEMILDAATAANTAINFAATSVAPLTRQGSGSMAGGKNETKAVYYKTIAKKCYQRMKQQKEAYELQIAGLRQQLEFAACNGSVNLNNLSFASTVAPGSPLETIRQQQRVVQTPNLALSQPPDVDDASLLQDEHF